MTNIDLAGIIFLCSIIFFLVCMLPCVLFIKGHIVIGIIVFVIAVAFSTMFLNWIRKKGNDE